ncbi:MAG: hypothetical protein JSW26_05465, partial [Desulfobacterales bacterium]
MSIRKKTLLVVGMTIFILLVSLAVTSRIMVLGGFTELEKQETRLDVERVLNNFSDIFAGLDATAKDWASWDASYAFVEDGNQRYIDENLTGSVLINLRLNFMLFFDEFGKLVAGKNIDLVQPAEMRLPPDFLKLPADRDLLLQHQDTAGSKTGFVMTSLGPAMVASRPITKSDYSGPIRGALVIGRYLDSLEIKRIASMMNLSFSVHAFNDDAKLSGFRALLPVLYKENEIAVKPVNSKSISGLMLQNDFYGNAAFIVEVTAPRIIYNRGRDTLVYFIIALFIIGLISIVFMMLMLEITVVSPLSRLS